MTAQAANPQLKPIRSILKGAGIVFFGAVIGNGFRYVFHLLVARQLGPALFGIFTLGFAVYKVTGMFAEMGLPQGLLRYIPFFRGKKDESRTKGVILLSFRAGFLAGVVLGLVIFLGSSIIAGTFFRKPELSLIIRLFALALPLATLTTMIVFSLQGFKRLEYKVYVRDLFEPIAKIAAVAVAFAAGLMLKGVILSILAVTLISVFLALFFLKKTYPDITNPRIAPIYEKKAFFGFSWPLLFVYLIGNLCLWTDTFILGLYRSAAEVGIYAAAQKTALMTGLVLTSFLAIFAPLASEYFSQKKQAELNDLYKTVSKWVFALTLPICSLLVVFPENILNIFGEDFPQGTESLIILALGWLIHSSMGTSGIVLTMSGRSKLHLLNFSILLAVNVTLNLLLVPRHGHVGAAFATSVSIVLIDILTLLEVRFILKMFPLRWDFLKPLAIGGGMFTLTKYFAPITGINYNSMFVLAAAAAVFIVFYVVLFLFLGTSKDEKSLLKQIVQRAEREE
jgi:O-antigen/teichoic acid export membrane protein